VSVLKFVKFQPFL